MMNTKTWLTALVLVVFVAGALGLVIWNESRPAGDDTTTQTPTPNENTYSMSEVATHIDATSCWTVIDGKVYDLTNYVNQHPGGSRAILGICGADGTGSFNSMPSSVLPAARVALALYKIGTLSQ